VNTVTDNDKHTSQVWKGIGITLLLNLLPFIYPPALFAIGVVQLIYMIPAMIIFRKESGVVQGMLIAMGITFLLNAACFGIVFGMF
jgi:hypothetical protein